MLKTKQAKTVQDAAPILGRNRVTLQEWLRHYREGGLAGLLAKKTPSGRPRAIPAWAEMALNKRLQEPQGFDGYQAICDWLETQLGVKAAYKTVHQYSTLSFAIIAQSSPTCECRAVTGTDGDI